MTDASVGVEVPEFDPVCLLECGELAGEGTNGREVPVRGGRGVESSSPKLKRNRKWVQKKRREKVERARGVPVVALALRPVAPSRTTAAAAAAAVITGGSISRREHQRAEASAAAAIDAEACALSYTQKCN